MFEIDVKGLAELEGGKPAHRIAFEPVANVFDEYRGYGDESRRKPTYCAVALDHSVKPRGVWITVTDNGAGFANERDIWTLFGTSGKRSAAGVSGRFNAGDKQLIAVARIAVVRTNNVTVTFEDGKREVVRHRERIFDGTELHALMPWSLTDLAEVRAQLERVRPPSGLVYTVDGKRLDDQTVKCTVHATIPTVIMADGVMRQSRRRSPVAVIDQGSQEPTLFELGIPVCSLQDVGFPWSLDVGQKIPVPMSRDQVTTSYLFQLIGQVIEQAAMDGVRLLTDIIRARRF